MNEQDQVVMRLSDFLETIFQRFLCLLTEGGVNVLVERCRAQPEAQATAEEITTLMGATAVDLVRLIGRDGDEEDKIKYLARRLSLAAGSRRYRPSHQVALRLCGHA